MTSSVSKLRNADAFYPGFEYAGLESPLDLVLTTMFCHVASACVAIKNAGTYHPSPRADSYGQPALEA